MIVIGIDPGKGGGIGIIDTEARWCGKHAAVKMPPTETDLANIIRKIHENNPDQCVCYLEKVASSPQQGVVSAFTFGKGYGAILGALAALKIRRNHVAPHVWQRHLQCYSKGNKNITKRRAQELFPELNITHAIADALLIAEYGVRVETGKIVRKEEKKRR